MTLWLQINRKATRKTKAKATRKQKQKKQENDNDGIEGNEMLTAYNVRCRDIVILPA